MPLHKQLVEILKTSALAGNPRISGDCVFVCLLHDLYRRIHLTGNVRKKRLINGAVFPKRKKFPKTQTPKGTHSKNRTVDT